VQDCSIMKCNNCPRKCNIDRNEHYGYCQSPAKIKVSRYGLHMWEEPCISGREGSGTIFFSGCNMKCIFCQNHEISTGKKGAEITVDRLSELMLILQEEKANNINLVTPSHYVPEICKAIIIAKDNGLSIPIVYNTSSYENVESIKMLEGLVDIYLPDFKYYDNDIALRYSKAPEYRDIATRAIDEMVRQCGGDFYDEREIMTRGVIVRHLILPGHTKDSMKIMEYLHDRYGDSICISIMSQFTPMIFVADYPELNRKITAREYNKVCDYALNIGIERGFFQEGDVAKDSFVPEFDFEG